MSILVLLRCCPFGPTFVTVLAMENMATALLHARADGTVYRSYRMG
jgi:hypothetical protein